VDSDSDIVLMVVIVVAAGAMGTVVVLCAVLAHKYCMLFTSVYFVKFQHILLPAHAQLPVARTCSTSCSRSLQYVSMWY